MTHHDTVAPVNQLIRGADHRTAGRDYHEHTCSVWDAQGWLEATPMASLNTQAIDSEHCFLRRFRFDAPIEQRHQAIAIKKHFDFTDREIRCLHGTGALRLVKGKPALLKADRFGFWWGNFMLAMAMVFVPLLFMQFAALARQLHTHTLSVQTILSPITVVAVMLGIFTFSYFTVFQPMNILRRRGFKIGEQFELPPLARV